MLLDKLKEYSLFTDENVDIRITNWLRDKGFDVFDTKESGLFGSSDEFLLELAASQNRIMISLDSDFGELIYNKGKPFIGLIFIRAGNSKIIDQINILHELFKIEAYIESPFLIIVEWKNGGLKVRIKNNFELN